MEKGLSLTYAKQIQGAMCFLVVFHHLSDYVAALSFFKYVGYLPVSVFLFYSGYGLSKSYTEKKDYLKNLSCVRIPSYVCVYILANLLYFCVRLFTDTLQITSIAGFLFGGNALVKYSWYIVLIVYLYIAFLVSFFLAQGNKRVAYVLLFCATVFWIMVMLYTGGGLHRVNAVLAFLAGCLVAEHKTLQRKIQAGRGAILVLLLCCLAFSGATYCSIHEVLTGIRLPLMMFTSVSFAVFSAMLAELTRLKTRFLKFFGRISLEFYVYQGLVMILLRNPHFQTSNDCLFFLLVLCGASLFGWLMHLVDGVICSGWKKLIRHHTKEIIL